MQIRYAKRFAQIALITISIKTQNLTHETNEWANERPSEWVSEKKHIWITHDNETIGMAWHGCNLTGARIYLTHDKCAFIVILHTTLQASIHIRCSIASTRYEREWTNNFLLIFISISFFVAYFVSFSVVIFFFLFLLLIFFGFIIKSPLFFVIKLKSAHYGKRIIRQ